MWEISRPAKEKSEGGEGGRLGKGVVEVKETWVWNFFAVCHTCRENWKQMGMRKERVKEGAKRKQMLPSFEVFCKQAWHTSTSGRTRSWNNTVVIVFLQIFLKRFKNPSFVFHKQGQRLSSSGVPLSRDLSPENSRVLFGFWFELHRVWKKPLQPWMFPFKDVLVHPSSLWNTNACKYAEQFLLF